MKIVAAVAQMNSKQDVAENLLQAKSIVERAAASGARLVVLPENFAYMGPESERPRIAESLTEGGPVLHACAKWAKELNCELVLGGFIEKSDDEVKPYNSCVHLNASGEVVSVYRKINLFDALVGEGLKYHESAYTSRGDRVVVSPSVVGPMGLSICFDVRFPGIYQTMREQGASIIAVPSAFTYRTGSDHWHVLLRARAIETQCYILAAAQAGSHYDDRRTYGHALVVDPWGGIVAECDAQHPDFVCAAIDADWINRVRTAMPMTYSTRR